MGNPRRALLAAAALALAVAVGACGSSSSSGRNGGTLTILNQGDFKNIDPGAAYYAFDYQIDYATQRPLYSYKPAQTTTVDATSDAPPTPDLAAGPPVISKDGKTVTVHIKHGIRFSPPVNREVTAADVKYAIDRGFSANVANGYASLYFPIAGAPVQPVPGVKSLPGTTTPDRYTIQIKLTRPVGLIAAEALSLPLSAPVPREYAAKYDKANPSTYGLHQVATGPYMIENDSRGNLTGYVAGKSITIVRNPNWNRATDYRPAKLDKIVVQEGFQDTASATKKVLTGSSEITGDFVLPGSELEQAVTQYASQVQSPYTDGFRYVALNTTKPPFNDINVRKAVIAGLDKTSLRQARGGPADGDIAYHFIPTQFPGFEQGGGASSPYDFMASPTASPAVSAKYFKAAGFASGKYTGPHRNITLVCDSSDPGHQVCLYAQSELRTLGFNPTIQAVPHEQMLSICGTPSKEPEVCPNATWQKDFYDPQTLLDPNFDGTNILPENNSNFPQLNEAAINTAFAKAATINNFAAREQAYGKIDKMVVAQAVGLPFVWEKQATAESSNVKGVINNFLVAWDLSYSALK